MVLHAKQQSVSDDLELIGDGLSFFDELYTMLESAQMFSDFTGTDIKTLAKYTRAYRIGAGKTLFKEGEKGGYMYVLTKGKVNIFKEADSRERKQILTLHAGKSMGEMSLLDGLHYSATAVTAEPCELLMFTKGNFNRLADEHPALGVKILHKLATMISLRLRRTTGVLVDYLD